MRLLLIHNQYGSSAPSGENQVFERESSLLRAAGHTVEELVVSNDGLHEASPFNLLGVAACAPWSGSGLRLVRRAIARFKPGVMHVHNTFPLLSPSVYYAAGHSSSSPAVVMTAHNYRMFCAAGNCMRDGALCTKCIETRSARHAVIHGCYRNSRLKSVPVAAMIGLHNTLGTFSRRVHAIIAQTEFQRDMLLSSGLPAPRIFVKPHCIVPKLDPLPWQDREDRVVFIGRLSPEKGLDMLLQAWKRLGDRAPELVVIGGGSRQPDYERLAIELGLAARVRFLGFVSEARKWDELRKSKLLVMPTQWYETFGLVFAEAFAVGVPVIASKLGCIPWVVQDGSEGVLVDPTDVDAWVQSVLRLNASGSSLQKMSENSYGRYRREYAVAGHVEQLEQIYAAAIATKCGARPDGGADTVTGVTPQSSHRPPMYHPEDLAS